MEDRRPKMFISQYQAHVPSGDMPTVTINRHSAIDHEDWFIVRINLTDESFSPNTIAIFCDNLSQARALAPLAEITQVS